jgi:hypothetical protein
MAWLEWCQSEKQKMLGKKKKKQREILPLLRLRGVAGMIDLEMQIEE